MGVTSKILFFVIVFGLLNCGLSKPHHKRHARSSHHANDPSKNPYQSLPGYPSQFYPPPFSSPYGYQPMQMPPVYAPYPNPYYMNMQYNPYMPMYQPYPAYFPNPYIQPYPYQHQFPTYPDPFAHIPAEIIDVDSDFTIENHKPKVEVESSQHVELPDSLQQPIKTSQVEESATKVEVKSTDETVKESGNKSEEIEKKNEDKSIFNLFG
uniref:Uncharacterized protein n=1 Tax=Photinus pyralis TaxID=7054 RepID=A0A1Y1MQ48_PHOPY